MSNFRAFIFSELKHVFMELLARMSYVKVLILFVASSVTQLIAESFVPSTTAGFCECDIIIDGKVVEPNWDTTYPVTQFIQGTPVEGAPAQEKTEVRVLHDKGTLYVGAIMYDSQPDLIGDQLVRRDERGQYDYFELSLDPNNDRRTGYRFRVSAMGVQRDVYIYDDVQEDVAWDAVWESGVHRDSSGWSVELRIPISQLHYEISEDSQSWGINFSRQRIASNERTYFALESRIRHGKVSKFGRLNGLQFISNSRHIEIVPYTLSSARSAPATPGDPFFTGSEFGMNTGLDLRYGFGSANSLDLTINPDFGQVEVDPAVINLSAFETFYQEKRPFFVENAQIFDFRLSGWRDRLFYSRRIGRKPHGSAQSESDFTKIPNQTRILGATKFTSRTSGGLSIGALGAVTQREEGLAFDTSNASQGQTRFTAEPENEYGIVRMQQDFRNGASQIGAIATGMFRNLPTDGSFNFLTSSAFSSGVDFEHNWGGLYARNWALSGYLVGSLIQGSPEALTYVQESSNHYFQRPDATRFSLDTTTTSMSGLNWQLQFERRSALHWTGGIWISELTPGFEINDMGYSQSSERLDAGGYIRYQEISPGRLFRSYRFNFFTVQNWRHEVLDNILSFISWKHAHKWGFLSANADFLFLNYWGLDLNIRFSPEILSDVATRGGPLMISPASTSLEIRVNSDRRNMVYFRPSVNFAFRDKGGYLWRSNLQVTIRPLPSWEIQLQPSYSYELEPAQYVTTIGDPEYAPTFGSRYIFAELVRNSFSVQTRINVVFTPKLTFQLFAQPLLSTGDYLIYKQLNQSESFNFDLVEEETVVDEDQDFNVRSLRMNMVVRWEYRPGSTLFFVWQRTSYSSDNIGSLDFYNDINTLWDAEPENVFMLKLNYWFGR